MSEKLDQLKAKLRELFQLDRPDLDFGFYRIMHAKQTEIDRFLDKDLLPQVQTGLDSLKGEGSSELEEAVKQARALGFDPEQSSRVRELSEKYGTAADTAKTEDEIYSHLYRFFSRYYDNGDFISMRRYKEGVYAIPYEGEEVVLHWANKDQYYIKSSENLRDYTVKLAAGDDAPRLHFKLIEADIEKDNVKTADDKNRVFIFNPETIEVQENAVTFGFEYRADTENRKQEVFIAACVDYVKGHASNFGAFVPLLFALSPTEKRKDRTLLEKFLADYTSKNTMDYFIHKDLGGFLRRELDFYIKNEVMHLDDIENETAPRVEQYLAQVRVIRGIAHKLIDFLAQLEDFQKKLWLKKKFVVESNWCITLDRVPDELFPQIAKNDNQLRNWVKLGCIEEAQIPQLKQWILNCSKEGKNFEQKAAPKDLFGKADSSPQPTAFSFFMLIETAFYDAAFKQKLLATIEDIDAQTDGLLIHSENFQTLNLLQESCRGQVKCITIDPPYNRLGDGFPYKDNYQHASWLSMMFDRLLPATALLSQEGALFSNIDENERDNLKTVLDLTLGYGNRVEELIWVQNTTHSQSPLYSTNHEYVEVYAANKPVAERDPTMFREPKPGYAEIVALISQLNPEYPPVDQIQQRLQNLFRKHIHEYKKELEEQGLTYDEDTKKQDPWRGLYNYDNAEYRTEDGILVSESEAGKLNARIIVWREDNSSAPAQKQADSTRDKNDPNYRFYKPFHPVTKKECPHPRTGWRWPLSWPENNRDSFEQHVRNHKIVWGVDETKIPQYKRFLHEVETNVSKSVFHDYTDGEKQLASLFGKAGVFPTPKPTSLPTRFVSQTCLHSSLVMDFFGGSGSTGHAVINLNREDGGKRKYILVEMGEHFDTVLKPRIQKVVFSKDWKEGKPTDPTSGVSHCFKYLRLESYEDCLNNLKLKRSGEQDDLLNRNAGLKEDYTLRYMLDLESRDSLLNVSAFADPFNYTLKVATGSVGETKPVKVDLVETFNYLIGLKVKTMDAIRGVIVVTGENLKGDKILVLWRKTAETDSEALNRWFVKQGYNTQDMEFDIIYVNGDNNLENLRRDEQTWKVRLTEEEFLRRMFATSESEGD